MDDIYINYSKLLKLMNEFADCDPEDGDKIGKLLTSARGLKRKIPKSEIEFVRLIADIVRDPQGPRDEMMSGCNTEQQASLDRYFDKLDRPTKKKKTKKKK